MVSTGVQADISDPEGLLGVIGYSHSELEELMTIGQSLLEMTKSRDHHVRFDSDMSNQLTKLVDELFDRTRTIDTRIDKETLTWSSNEQELQDLLNEKERLDAAMGGREQHISEQHFANEERLTGFIEDEIDMKIDELSNLHTRLTEVKEEYTTEWGEFKTEIHEYDADKARYEETTDHLEELKLARCVGAQTGNDSSDSELIKRLVGHHLNQITQRDLLRQLTDSRMKEKDLEDEIGDLMKQKQELWKRCLDLENCLEEMQDTSEEASILRPAATFPDLVDVVEGIFPTFDINDHDLAVGQVFHGRLLHRCEKNINLAVNLSAEEKEDIEAFIKRDTGPTDKEEFTHTERNKEQYTSAAAEDKEENGPSDYAQPDPDNSDTQNLTSTLNSLPTQIRQELGGVEEQTFMTKMRKRIGLLGRRSATMKIKGDRKLKSAGSQRRFSTSNL